MRGDFDDGLEPVRQQRDTEFTLGSTALVAIFFGMVLLCGLFFGLGFAAGRYAPSESQAPGQAASGVPATAIAAGSHAKPSPVSATPSKSSVSVPVTDDPQPSASASAPPQAVSRPAVQQVAQSVSPQPVAQSRVKPALPLQPAPPQQVPVRAPAPTTAAQPSGIMVQIAVISHQEDANVLVGALRKRGFSASAHRQPADNMIHVQVGPLRTPRDANAMRQRLLSDGYNAVVLQ